MEKIKQVLKETPGDLKQKEVKVVTKGMNANLIFFIWFEWCSEI